MRPTHRARTERATVAILCVAAALGLAAHGSENDGRPGTIRFPSSGQQPPDEAPPPAVASAGSRG